MSCRPGGDDCILVGGLNLNNTRLTTYLSQLPSQCLLRNVRPVNLLLTKLDLRPTFILSNSSCTILTLYNEKTFQAPIMEESSPTSAVCKAYVSQNPPPKNSSIWYNIYIHKVFGTSMLGTWKIPWWIFSLGGCGSSSTSVSLSQGAGSSSKHWFENSVVCGDCGGTLRGTVFFSQVILHKMGKKPFLVGSGTHPPIGKKTHESWYFWGGKGFVQ